MTKKIMTALVVLTIGVIVSGGILLLGSNSVEAAASATKSIDRGCREVCTPFLTDEGWWETFCVSSCDGGNY